MRITASNMLSPAQKKICAAVGVSEKAFLRTYALESIGRPRTYHSVRPGDDDDDDAAGRGYRDNDGDESLPETHVGRAAGHLEAYHDEETDMGRRQRLVGARAAIDRAMECHNGGGRDAMMRFVAPVASLPNERVGKYASFTSNELTRAMVEIKRASH